MQKQSNLTEQLHAQQLISDNECLAARKLLESVDCRSLKGTELANHLVLLAESWLFTGKKNGLTEVLDNAIEMLRFTDQNDLYAKAKYLKGWHEADLGEFSLAKETLLESYAGFLRCRRPLWAARALNRLAYVVALSGNLSGAAENLEKCIQLYVQVGKPSCVTEIEMNAACIYSKQGLHKRSIKLYVKISDRIVTQGDKNALIFYEMSAIPHALRGDFVTARKTIAKCKPYLEGFARERAIYYENLGWIDILEGKYENALKELKTGLELSIEIAPRSALISQIKRLMADACVGLEDYERARQYATEGLEVAEHINERLEIAACHRIFGHVEAFNSNYNKAREWFGKAIDMMNLIGARYDLAVTRVMAAESGAYDEGERTALGYLAREYFELEELTHLIKRVDAVLKAAPPAASAKDIKRRDSSAPLIITRNAGFRKVLRLARNVARSKMTVFLTGPTGTGKDLLARYIHHHSDRTGRFVSFNAAAIPGSMIEAELFGYKRGAFTGAEDRVGLLESADKGTFYLNEVGDASLEFQAKLLEVLETREIRRLGQNETKKVDFRLIAATNYDIQKRIEEGKFRADLYHRLNEVPLSLPPLSDRAEDIEPLTAHFLAQHLGIEKSDLPDITAFAAALTRREFEGNIRQLRGEIISLAVESSGDVNRLTALAEESARAVSEKHLLTVLDKTGWNRRETARLLGVNESTVRYRMRKFNVSEPNVIQ